MKNSLYSAFLLLIMNSCVLPVNLNYETAELIAPKKVEFAGSLSIPYAIPTQTNYYDTTFFKFDDLSFGARLSIGTSERTNLSFRYESTKINDTLRQSFGEIQLKFSLGEGFKFVTESRKASIGLPFQFYTYADYSAIAFNPRWYFTFFYDRPRFDLTVIPKLHGIISLDEYQIPVAAAGVTVNCTLSSNKQKWAFRPELGILGRTFGFGVSFMVRF